ncbi:uncharacterized protein [Nicotiana tomentosiformis]|uniref:uncharacterized protein n=1 Tax=Nicotiana tomentosiformis TaxID=4098 RepID=UPI00388CCA3A
MGLNEIYVSVRINLLMRQPLPSLDIACNILLQDDSQRHISYTPQFNSDSTSFNFTRGRRVIANATDEPEFTAAGHNADGSSYSGSSGHSSIIPGLSMEQYNQLLTLLQQSHVSDTSLHSNLMASANFVDTLLSGDLLNVASSSSCMLSQTVNLTWIIDSGATDHMASNKDFLTNLTHLLVPYLVSLPNGYKVKVTSTGSFALHPSLILHNVLNIPSFQHNLISGPSLKKPLDLGKLDSGLYKLVWKRPSQSQPFTDLQSMNNAKSSSVIFGSTFACNFPISSSIPIPHISASTCNYSCPSLPNVPSYSYLRSFGCLGYATIPTPHRDKLKPRVVPCIFLGCPFAKKGYKLYNLTAKKCFISRDVIFHEHYFPFSQSHVVPGTTSIPSPYVLTFAPAPSTIYPESSDSPLYPSLPSPPSSSFFDVAAHLSPYSSSPPSAIVAPSSSPTVSPPFPISSIPLSSVPSPRLRRSSGEYYLPTYLQDYVCSLPRTSTSSCSNSILEHDEFEPSTYSQSTFIPAWQDVMRKKFEALCANHTWDVVELPRGKKVIGCK